MSGTVVAVAVPAPPVISHSSAASIVTLNADCAEPPLFVVVTVTVPLSIVTPAMSGADTGQTAAGEIRDRTTEGQHYRMAGLNLLAAIIIYWNTKHLGHAVTARKRAGLDCPPHLLAHISPLGWAHILLTGEYRWVDSG